MGGASQLPCHQLFPPFHGREFFLLGLSKSPVLGTKRTLGPLHIRRLPKAPVCLWNHAQRHSHNDRVGLNCTGTSPGPIFLTGTTSTAQSDSCEAARVPSCQLLNCSLGWRCRTWSIHRFLGWQSRIERAVEEALTVRSC